MMITAVFMFAAIGFTCGIFCEKAVKAKKHDEAIFFGLSAVAGAFFASAMAIICFLAVHPLCV
jgi:hypothetical protein